jgi:hypothetical protein
MKEWFGDPKAPYAICLSCRVEINGEKKKVAAEVKIKRANCAICAFSLFRREVDLCSKCEAGLRAFDNSPKLLGRAASYAGGKLRRPRKSGKRQRLKVRNVRLQKLIRDQHRDDSERGLRFEHAISK